jgi:hypothetical protein
VAVIDQIIDNRSLAKQLRVQVKRSAPRKQLTNNLQVASPAGGVQHDSLGA